MAYWKGNTYVDGDLFVEGSLKVKRLLDNSGLNIPYLVNESSSISNRIIKFDSTFGEEGGVNHSQITENILSNNIVYTFNKDKNSLVKLSIDNLPLEITEVMGVHFETSISNITAKEEDANILMPLVKEGTTLPTKKGVTPKITINSGDRIFTDSNGYRYKVLPARPSDPNNPYQRSNIPLLPWFTPQRYCYRKDLS